MMFSLITAAAVAAAPLSASVSPSAPASVLSRLQPDPRQDLQCATVFALIAGSNDTKLGDVEKTGIAGAVLYFLGRIEAMNPGFDLGSGIGALVEDKSFQNAFPSEAKRCGEAMRVKGQNLVAIGKALQAKGSAPGQAR